MAVPNGPSQSRAFHKPATKAPSAQKQPVMDPRPGPASVVRRGRASALVAATVLHMLL